MAARSERLTRPAAGEGEEQAEVLFRHAAQQICQAAGQAPQASIGVLVRTNQAVARLIYLLRSLGIPASVVMPTKTIGAIVTQA